MLLGSGLFREACPNLLHGCWVSHARLQKTHKRSESAAGYADNETSAPVAQVDRAVGFEPTGREFDPLRARQQPTKYSMSYAIFRRLDKNRRLSTVPRF